ncbi:MAG: isoprenylcysteine carboxyl methyltransferase family protein [Myxococcota bacterium]
MTTWYLLLLALVALGRLGELVVSKRNRERMVREHGAQPGRDPIFPVMVFLHAMPFWAIPLELTLLPRSFEPVLGFSMLAVFILATVLRVWTLRTLGRYWNAQVMVPPDLEPVQTGPYAYIRHPNYAVVILELVSLPLMYGCVYSFLALNLLNAWVLYYRITAEEAQLLESPAYRAAMGHKKRFIPGVF